MYVQFLQKLKKLHHKYAYLATNFLANSGDMDVLQACVAGLVREEKERWGGLPAAGALYGTAGFRDR